jgi:mannose/fructose/N-acetylgalactosamine-specific phosphotransferase system component IIC
VASLAGLVAHGGILGAIAESLIAVAVVGIFVAVWIRERRARREQAPDGPTLLTDRDEE